ncbi:MAG: hypothetical protein F6J87_11080 [Spirulina sp. SIO3F2]|nr:hypothetical protein [Spirulina sp. SIO3F2]
MVLNWPVKQVAYESKFWTDYFWLTSVGSDSDYSKLINRREHFSKELIMQLYPYKSDDDSFDPDIYVHCSCRHQYPIGADFEIILDVDPYMGSFDLEFQSKDGVSEEIAWDDQAHWHPHVLRWDELDVICRCIALLDSGLPHPGIPLLLLCRFAPITDSEDSEYSLSLLRQAWNSLNLFTDSEIEAFIERVDRRGQGFEWKLEPTFGWILDQDYDLDKDLMLGKAMLYTLRHPENSEFPFLEFQRMIEEAKLIVSLSEQTS